MTQRWRRLVEELPALDITVLRREGALEGARTIQTEGVNLEVEVWPHRSFPGVERLLVSLGGVTFTALPLTRTRCNYGGDRPWFVCCVCGRRAGKLYILIHDGMVSCRRCARLGYPSENELYRDRLRRKARKLRARLGWREWKDVPEKPLWMHWTTYSDLVHAVACAERIAGFTGKYWGLKSVPPSRLPMGLVSTGRAQFPITRSDWWRFWKDRHRAKRRERVRQARAVREAWAEADPSWFEDPGC